VIRDGFKLHLMYHERCYSDVSNPRTQAGSSYHNEKWPNARSIHEKVLSPIKRYGKWSCSEYAYKVDLYAAAPNVKSTRS